MKHNPMTTLATLEAMVATKDPKERIQIYRAANPDFVVDDLFTSIFGGAKK